MLAYVLWGMAIYLVIGVAVAWFLSRTPYVEAGLLWIALLWPLFVWGNVRTVMRA